MRRLFRVAPKISSANTDLRTPDGFYLEFKKNVKLSGRFAGVLLFEKVVWGLFVLDLLSLFFVSGFVNSFGIEDAGRLLHTFLTVVLVMFSVCIVLAAWYLYLISTYKIEAMSELKRLLYKSGLKIHESTFKELLDRFQELRLTERNVTSLLGLKIPKLLSLSAGAFIGAFAAFLFSSKGVENLANRASLEYLTAFLLFWIYLCSAFFYFPKALFKLLPIRMKIFESAIKNLSFQSCFKNVGKQT